MAVQSYSHAARHMAGPTFVGMAALVYDVWAIQTKRPTVSSGVKWLVKTGRGAELAGAAIGALLFHLFLFPPREEN